MLQSLTDPSTSWQGRPHDRVEKRSIYTPYQCICCVENDSVIDINTGNNGNNVTYDCYACCLKGLVRELKSSSIMYPQRVQYELILDRPSLLAWWNHHHHHSTIPSSSQTNETMIVELIRVLQQLKSNGSMYNQDHVSKNASGGDNTTARVVMNDKISKNRKIRISSAFLSMDIFSQMTSLDQAKDDNGLSYQRDVGVQCVEPRPKKIQKCIRTLLQYLNETLPQLQSVHFYNSPTGSVSMSADNFQGIDDTNREHLDAQDEDGNDGNQNDTVNIDNEGSSESSRVDIDGETLASVIESWTLQSIIVTRCLYLNDSQDICALSKSMKYYPTLSTVHFLSVRINPIQEKQFCLDPIVSALATIAHLESINITLMKSNKLALSVPTRYDFAQLHETTIAPTDSTFISPQALGSLIGIPALKDLSVWECKLNGSHLSAISSALLDGMSHSTIDTSAQSKLEFLSLRCNPNISSDAWCHFYTRTLPHCYSIQSIYNDHVCGLADCDPVHMNSRTEFDHYLNCDATRPGASKYEVSTAKAVANAELFLGLNSLGRGSIIHGTYSCLSDDSSSSTEDYSDHTENEEDLFDLLLDLSDTPSAIYALIRSHPMMVMSLHR